MQKTLFAAVFLAVALYACKQDSKTPSSAPPTPQKASVETLGGYWIAMDFCARANQYGSVLQAMNNAHLPYAYSFTFNPGQPDSVTCFNGIETWNLPAKYRDTLVELVGAAQGKSIFLSYNALGEKDITMFDATGGSAKMDRFIKSSAETKDGSMAFVVALNHNLFGGSFTLLAKGASGNILFTPGGFIQGFKDYDRYKVCIRGDCFVTGDAMDVITLSNSKQENLEKIFGFRYSAQNDTLTIYNLMNTKPNEKAAYKIGTPVYKFLRKNS